MIGLLGAVAVTAAALGTIRLLVDRRLAAREAPCESGGWRPASVDVDGRPRELLWRGPDVWRRGAIIALHGGSGTRADFCAPARLVDTSSSVAFAAEAVDAGFAVLALESTSDAVIDESGRVCGKVWDDEVRNRPNVDLNFIRRVVEDVIPSHRPPSSNESVFLTGLSSGGFMTVRAATHMGDRIAAVAAVSAGDPYGWRRRCDPDLGRHGLGSSTVWGQGFDRDTDREIGSEGACEVENVAQEVAWEIPPTRPPIAVIHAQQDGVVDTSCHQRLVTQLRRHGYATTDGLLDVGGVRSPESHLWKGAYSRRILDFFSAYGS